MSFLWCIDAAARSGERELFAASSEYHAAVNGLAPLSAAGALHPELLPHLYAYELIERTREHGSVAGARLRVPLWPPALFAAAELERSSWSELLLLVPGARCTWVRADADAIASALALHLPGWRCEPARYAAELERLAREGSWIEVRS